MKRMMKKAVSMVTFLVVLAMIAITVVALSYAVFKILVILGVISPQVVCEWSIVLIAVGKYGTSGLLDIPPECKTDYIEIRLADLEELENEAARQIRFYRTQVQRGNTAWNEIYSHFNNPDDRKQRLEWALNQKMATELTKCWSKVWQGDLPLFDEWWDIVDWELFGLVGNNKPTSREAALRAMKSTPLDVFGVDEPLVTFYGPPTFCIYCARIVIDPKIKTEIGKTKITSLTDWLKAKPVRAGSSESLFQFLLNENQRKFPVAQRGIDYSYSLENPQAVEFVRTNALGSTILEISDAIQSGVKTVMGTPQDDTSEDPSNSRLVIIPAKDSIYPFINSGLQTRVVCLQQIG